MFAAEPGVTLLIPSGPRGYHLFIVITEPRGPAHQVLMVPVTTRREFSDLTCILGPGDHEFLQHASVIEYRHARLERSDDLARGVQSGLIVEKDRIAADVLARIRGGFAKSSFVKPFARDFLDEHRLAT